MPDNDENLVQWKDKANWLDIFFNVLVSPIRTFDFISSPELYSAQLNRLLGSMAIVIIAALADSCVNISSLTQDELIADIASSILTDLFFWFILAIFARLLAAVMNVRVSIRSCLLVTGWSFTPLLLKAPTACFSNVTMLGDILSAVISLWFLVLVLFSFDSLLKLGKLKTFAFIILLPPCLFFSYLMATIFASKFIVDGFF